MKQLFFLGLCLILLVVSKNVYCQEESGLSTASVMFSGYELLNQEILALQKLQYNQFIVLALNYDSTLFYSSLPDTISNYFEHEKNVSGYALMYKSKDTVFCKIITDSVIFMPHILPSKSDSVFDKKLLKSLLFSKNEEGDRINVFDEAYGYHSSGLYFIENKKTKYFFLDYMYNEPNSEFEKKELKRKHFLDYLHSIIIKILPSLKFEKYHLINFYE